MWNLGAFSTNDIRELEDMSPVEGGDVRYRPLNMGVLGQLDTAADPAADPTADPGADPTTDPAPDDTPSSAEQALQIVTAIQKGYLGVGAVVTVEEMREIVNGAGANLAPGNPFEEDDPPAPVEPVAPETDGSTDDQTEGVPAGASTG
jgi:hypothetical protein